MNTNWNLDVMYEGLSDPRYEADFSALSARITDLETLAAEPDTSSAAGVEKILQALEENVRLASRLGLYIGLSLSVNTEDGQMMAQQNRLDRLESESAAAYAALKEALGGLSEADAAAFAAQSELVSAYSFLLKQLRLERSHMLSGKEEAMASALDITGGSAWGNLQSYLTSTVKVDYAGKTLTLSEVRNLAYDPDSAVRKAAYEAEIASYDKIKDSVAFALNNIKNQVSYLSDRRGYSSPLDMTLQESWMTRETLDALLSAIEDFLPSLRRYLRHKAELLGHKNGLPWYDLFAPVGSSGRTYTIAEADEYLQNCFHALIPEMADMMHTAFTSRWIDFYPHSGKQGGAFCAGAWELNQSRVLTNFDGSYGAVDTLAHELGHAYHNHCMNPGRIMNQDPPMTVAETASTFNEVHLGRYALAHASSDAERLYLLDSELREDLQCIIDIYSRYRFESAVFAQSREQFLMSDDLCALMLEAQDAAYGDGLDPDCRHPYMWVCKSHYYSSGLSFYNFPYAFGNLFALGLYALFQKDPVSFVPNYQAMLRATPTQTCEENGAMMGVDLTKKDFWSASLRQLADEVDEFCRL